MIGKEIDMRQLFPSAILGLTLVVTTSGMSKIDGYQPKHRTGRTTSEPSAMVNPELPTVRSPLMPHPEVVIVETDTPATDGMFACSESQNWRCWNACEGRPSMARLLATRCQADTSEDGSGTVSLRCECYRATVDPSLQASNDTQNNEGDSPCE